MESFIIYMAKASGLLSVFFAAYYFLLRKETFFNSNRIFLLAGLLTAMVLPSVRYTKTIWVESTPEKPVTEIAKTLSPEQLQQLIITQQMAATEPVEFVINWWYVFLGIYIAGALFFVLRFASDFAAIHKLLRYDKIIKEGNYNLIDSNKAISPFSFFNYIVYNSSMLSTNELANVISHEKVHSSQKHSIDMIVSQLFCIAFWFNPIMWLYRKSVSQNLEFIADAVAVKQVEDSKAYQKTLLKITLQPEGISIINHFYQSLIKKRIVMLNKKQSKKHNSWKYAIVIPALAAFIFGFQVKVVAQEKEPVITSSMEESIKMEIEINKGSQDDELAEGAEVFKDQFDANVTFSDLRRNALGEITSIKVHVKDKNQSRDYIVTGNKPIQPFTIALEKRSGDDQTIISFGGNPGKNLSVEADSIRLGVNNNGNFKDNASLNAAKTLRKYNTDTIVLGNRTVAGKTQIYKGALVILNGVILQKDADMTEISLPKGEAISQMQVLSPKEARKKYGKEAKKGAIEIQTKRMLSFPHFPKNYSYGIQEDDDGTEISSFGDVMAYANMGINEGMKVLSDMNFDIAISEKDRKHMKEDLENARKEINEAFSDPEFVKQMTIRLGEADAIAKGTSFSYDHNTATNELKQAAEELKKAKKELENARRELDKSRAERKKRFN